MTSPAWENLDDFLSTDDFATAATFTNEGGQVFPAVRGIFDEPSFNAEAGEYDMATSQPRFTCKAADVVGLKKHATTVIGGKAYVLDHDPYPDGTGMAVLHMSRDFGD